MARVSAFFLHMQRFYAALDAAAAPSGDTRVYKGHPTKLVDAMKLPAPYYSKLMRDLERMGCLTRVRRGARNAESEIVLHKPPTQEDFLALDEEAKSDEERTKESIRKQQHKDLVSRIETIEKHLGISS